MGSPTVVVLGVTVVLADLVIQAGGFRALAKAIDAILANSLDRGFADVVAEYRQIETDFVARAEDDEYFALETKRRIAEAILLVAHSHEQPFEVCRDAWNDLLRLGFTNIEVNCSMTWFYADCCLFNEQFDAGIAVVEPLLVDLRQRLAEALATGKSQGFYRQEIERFEALLGELQSAGT